MIIELLIALVVGIIVGTITGLIPGIHINLVATILLSISAVLLAFTSPISLVVFIVSLSITHTFIDFIPSIFLGAPNEDTILSILPGHKLLLDGYGFEAVIYSIFGSLTGILILIFFIPVFIFLLPIIYPYIERIIWLILVFSSIYLIYLEKNKRIFALFIFLFSGILGIIVLNLNINEPLLPLLTGLFGASGLIISINQKTMIPNQQIFRLKEIKISKSSFFKSTLSSLIASPLPAFLPGMGSSQAAIIGSQINEKINEKEFLFLIGSINIIVMSLSFIVLYSINKTRTGSAVAIFKLIDKLSQTDLLIIITTIVLSGFFAFLITIYFAKIFSRIINKINYQILSLSVLIFLTIFIFYFSGLTGLIVFITSSALGIMSILLGIKRTLLMGCLMIPTILFYVL